MGKRNFKYVMIALLSLVLVTAACSQSQNNQGDNGDQQGNEENITIEFGYWGNETVLKAYEYAVEGLDEVVPGVTVKFVQFPSDSEFWDSLPSRIVANTAPDIVNITNERYLEFINGGLILPLDENEFDMSNISQSAKDIWTVDGKLYGFPYTAAPAGFVVNLDLWEEAGLTEEDLPKTWQEVREAAEILTKDDVYGLTIDIDSEFHLTQYALSFGGGWGEGTTIDSPENAKAMDYIINMFKDRLAVSPKQLGQDWDGAVFASGKAAMSTGGIWYMSNLAAAAPDMNYKIIPVPQVDPEAPAETMHSDAFVALKHTKHPDIVMKVINYMARKDFQDYAMKNRGIVPSDVTISDQFYEMNPRVARLQEAVEYSVSFGYPPQTYKFTNSMINAIGSAIYQNDSKMTGQDVVKLAAQDFNQ
ncbi:ABC transporter substrate-binding protein [Paenibacillus sp. J2TS4]|uniref:ABC transporter substrate-binding protein n=1 Tax=Paenibacillus sp. J2TS4 TaxID=2807194 RepID=UPI001B1E38B6|nr:sugar ABC transporter substrate-binding protein [Paenibacillus sp. J2TS4]GIP30971.1 ABC transporter substrate-binding protein [Paenibacillus sp. J2TS4]